ncbi:MAG: nucleotidyltransferase family protein [Pseudomonas sp.]
MDHLPHLQAIVAADPIRLRILRQVRALELADCWVGAGFVRSAVWDHLHQRKSSPLPADVDVVWFDKTQASRASDAHIEGLLRSMDSTVNWSIKNQAYMHLRNDDPPYSSVADAMTHWPETATAVAVRMGVHDLIEVAAPLGLSDLFNLVVRPTARFQGEKWQVFQDRLNSKNWRANWPELKILPHT